LPVAASQQRNVFRAEVVMKGYAGLFVFGALFFSAAMLGMPGRVVADTDSGFRCGGRLILLGDHQYDVQKKCGDPESITQRLEKRKVKNKIRRWTNGVAQDLTEEREIEVTIDEWVYDFGPHRFVRYLSFEDNRVVNIRSGERGRRND
jgi:hypothetical protein